MKNTLITWKLYKTHTKKSLKVQKNLSQYFNLKHFFNSKGNLEKFKYFLKTEPFSLLMYPNIIFVISTLGYQDIKFIFPFIIIYLLTTLNYFNHLGESIRYFEYGLTFIVPVLLIKQTTIDINLILSLNIFLILIYFIFKLLNFKIEKDHLSDFIENSKIKENSIIFSGSMRTCADICARGKFYFILVATRHYFRKYLF